MQASLMSKGYDNTQIGGYNNKKASRMFQKQTVSTKLSNLTMLGNAKLV